MTKGMCQAKQALFSGCFVGGLAAILRCDDSGNMFPPSTRVKCWTDAGFFLDAIDVSGGRSLRRLYAGVVKLQVGRYFKNILNDSTLQCFFPQNLINQIKTPLFILNTAYDSWQIQESLATKTADRSGSWHDCRLDYTKCNATQIQFLQGFRNRMVNLIKGFANPSKNGVFLNSCFAHCQTERHDTWYSKNSLSVNNKLFIPWIYAIIELKWYHVELSVDDGNDSVTFVVFDKDIDKLTKPDATAMALDEICYFLTTICPPSTNVTISDHPCNLYIAGQQWWQPGTPIVS
ncbi:unnamed protein product [Eruca vesicaria subsp. sativa]|uniref:Pectin acetylesterase n=1 Tax=Eruca vesicaria subsp. sativa TaxID=29727 RepID=A0ABC8J0Q7_ERUVS|nr:unnamed protein product [Eruca vesicaria subsp. sativa]